MQHPVCGLRNRAVCQVQSHLSMVSFKNRFPITQNPEAKENTNEFNHIKNFPAKWMELENIILSEVSLAQKTKNCMFSLICGH
jgi:glutaredoxin-related protein